MNGKPIDLTPREFRLLDTMIRQPGRAFDRSELIAGLIDDVAIYNRALSQTEIVQLMNHSIPGWIVGIGSFAASEACIDWPIRHRVN